MPGEITPQLVFNFLPQFSRMVASVQSTCANRPAPLPRRETASLIHNKEEFPESSKALSLENPAEDIQLRLQPDLISFRLANATCTVSRIPPGDAGAGVCTVPAEGITDNARRFRCSLADMVRKDFVRSLYELPAPAIVTRQAFQIQRRTLKISPAIPSVSDAGGAKPVQSLPLKKMAPAPA